MSSIRTVEQTSLKSKVLHIGLGIILATSLLPIPPINFLLMKSPTTRQLLLLIK